MVARSGSQNNLQGRVHPYPTSGKPEHHQLKVPFLVGDMCSFPYTVQLSSITFPFAQLFFCNNCIHTSAALSAALDFFFSSCCVAFHKKKHNEQDEIC